MALMSGTFFRKTEAVVRRCSVKMVFLEILQNSEENTGARVSFLIKLQAKGLSSLISFASNMQYLKKGLF